jgi:hypothetical protein
VIRAKNCNSYPVDTPEGSLAPGDVGEFEVVPMNLTEVPQKAPALGAKSKTTKQES